MGQRNLKEEGFRETVVRRGAANKESRRPEPKEGSACRCPTKGNAVRRNRQITIVGIADLVPIHDLSLSVSHSMRTGPYVCPFTHTFAGREIPALWK